MSLMNSLVKVFGHYHRLYRKFLMIPYLRKKSKKCGKNLGVGPGFIVSGIENMSFGDDVNIGPNCVFYSTHAELKIGRCVMFGPHVTIVTGEHRSDVIGEFMRYLPETGKSEENDKDVIIEDDCWIGSNVTILKGVRIGRGSIIHAGAVVSSTVKPYTIYVSDKLKISRFTDEEIQEHERLLKEKYGVSYPEYHPKDQAISRR